MRTYWSTQYGNLWIKNARTFGFVGIANFNYSIPFSSQKHSEMTMGLLFPFYKPGLIQAGLSFQITEFSRATIGKDMCW